MIINIEISNYKSIKSPILVDFNGRNSIQAMFGKNNSGKTTIFESIYMFKEVFLYGMRSVERIENQAHTAYNIEFSIYDKVFRYQVIIDYDKSQIMHEALWLKTTTTTHLYFKRDQYDIEIGDKLEKLFSPSDFERFKVYLYDLKFDRREFILTNLRIKDFSDSQNVVILNDLVDQIKNIHIINQKQDIQFFMDMTDSHYLSVLHLVQTIHPNVSSLSYRQVSLDELRYNLNRHRYDHLLDEFRSHVTKYSASNFFVEVYDQFYKLSGKTLNDLVIQAVDVHFKDGSVYPFENLSSGLKKALLLSMVLTKHQQNALICIDDLTKSLDHGSTIKLLSHAKKLFDLGNNKLIFSSHDLLLLDSYPFDLKDIIYIYHHNTTKLKYFNTFGIRKDKKLLNLYYEGFFDTLT